MTGPWLRVAEVADMLGFTPRTISTWIDRGDLPACRLPNGRLRIPQTAVDRLLDGGMTHPERRIVALPTEGGSGADRISE